MYAHSKNFTRGIEMSSHDIAILLTSHVVTIGAGALVGYIIDKSRKARR